MSAARNTRFCRIWPAIAGLASLLPVGRAWAQKTPVTLPQVVALAVRQFPQVEVARRTAAADRDATLLARLAYLPRLRLYGQLNRATDNNLGGLLFPNALPVIGGPVLPSSAASFWGSTIGASVAWEPYAFGRRRAEAASAGFRALSARQRYRLARLRAGTAAAGAFFAGLAAGQELRASRSDVKRWRSVDRTVHALVAAQLRPAGDAARVDSELAAARVSAVQAKEALRQADYRLAEGLGLPRARLSLQAGRLPSLLPASATPPGQPNPRTHPAVRAQVYRLAAAMARQQAISRRARPRLYLMGAADARTARGLAPANPAVPEASAANWAVGASIQFSISGWLRTRRRERIALDQARAQQARDRAVREQFEAAVRGARAYWRAAWRTARITPAELAAARTGEADARARYQAGLSSIVDLVNAEQVLSRALSADALARLNVWQSLLRWDYLRGHLRPFLRAVRRDSVQGRNP